MYKKLLVNKKGKIYLKNYKLNNPRDHQVLLKTKYSSCKHGTENWIIKNKAHWLNKKRDKEGRIFIENSQTSKYPVELGNIALAKVLKIGNKVKKFKIGQEVMLYGGAKDAHLVDENELFGIPRNASWQDMCCFDPIEFALGAVRDSNIKIGDNVGVFGLGAIGLLVVQLCKLQGANKIIAVDPNKTRRLLAKKFGADYIYNPTKQDVGILSRASVSKIGLDVTIDFSGTTDALNEAIRSTAYGGRVVAGSMYKPSSKKLKLGMEFHWNNITIISSRVSNEPNAEHPRWNRKRVHETILKLISEKKLKTKDIVSPVVSFKRAVKIYNKIKKNKLAHIKLTFKH